MLDTAPATSDLTAEGLPPVRRRQPLWALAAAGLAVVAFILIYVTFQQAADRTLVWSLAVDVDRGQPAGAAQLQAVEVAADDTAGLLPAEQFHRAGITDGRTWAADLPAGQLLSPSLLLDGPSLQAGQALIGLALPPGRWPSPGLAAGARVAVLATDDDGAASVLVDAAVVDSVTALGDAPSSQRLVSVVVPHDQAGPVAAAAAAGRVT